jgi:hypothetical protein
MKVTVNPRQEPALTLEVSRAELPVFKAALERANFIDIRPDQQAAVIDFVGKLLAQIPDDDGPAKRRF